MRRRLQERAGEEPVLIVPTGDDAAWFERELCADGAPSLGISIRTFGWLFRDLATSRALDTGRLLTVPQRLALIRAAISTTRLRRLSRSSGRPGFAPALDSLIEELQAGLISPDDLAGHAASLDDGSHETELVALYSAYTDLRERSGRADRGALATAVLASLRAGTGQPESRPVFVYGFDDLTLAQRELLGELARTADVTMAVNYADRRSLAARATLVGTLREELGAEIEATLEPDPSYTPNPSLRHLDASLFEPDPGTVPVDDGVVLLECAGERGEAEAIGLEIARLLAEGVEPGDVAVVTRNPSASGNVLARVLSGYGVPVALEADAPLDRTAVGRALISLCRAAGKNGTAEDLLAHLRADPSFRAGSADGVEERIRRGKVLTPGDVYASWKRPPRHLARLRAAPDDGDRLRVLAAAARELAESAHREQAPLAAPSAAGGAEMLHPIELRAAVAAAELLSELATLGELPDCPQPGLADAIEALEGASVPTWRGPTDGRVRILSPYRLRAGRARYLFCAAMGDGEFPAAAPPDPLLGDDRRRALGIPALVRRDQADEERYLFHSCVSRPTERLYLSWRSCNDEGTALARSPFIDEVLDLLGEHPEDAEAALKRRRGLEDVVPAPAEAPSERELARALAARGAGADHAAVLGAIGVSAGIRDSVLESLQAHACEISLPGPLSVPRVLDALRERQVLSAGQLERWLACPYMWFVQHELKPRRLDPESDPLWLGGVIHTALERLYRERPGADAIPRSDDAGRWTSRFDELLDEEIAEARLGPERVALVGRVREQVARFLAEESESQTGLRPREDLLERGFGMDGEEDAANGLQLGDFTLRGKIDRIDMAADGSGAVVRDYKSGGRVPGAEKLEDEGSLQIQLYMLVARDVLDLEVIGGLYQPLGAVNTAKRKPRGVVRKGDERLDGLDLVSRDRKEEDQFNQVLDAARELAIVKGGELRSGAITRAPLGGKCSRYCTFQPICRLERALGLPEEGNGDDA